MICILSIFDNQKASKHFPGHFTQSWRKFKDFFKDLYRNFRIFQGKMQFKDFWRTSLEFKDFSRLCEPCNPAAVHFHTEI